MIVEHENQAAEEAIVSPVSSAGPQMRLRNPDGSREPMPLEKLTVMVRDFSMGLPDVNVDRIAGRVFSGMYDGIPVKEFDKLLVQIPAALTAEEPSYSRLAARLWIA